MWTAEFQSRSDAASHILIMGTSGCGKTTIGELLARHTGLPFVDGDDLHPPANIAKMRAGVPLTDEDRWPWLDTVGNTFAQAESGIIIACSALKKVYRDRIRVNAGEIRLVYLRGTLELIAARMAKRHGHFMPETLLQSQFAILEPPKEEERPIVVEIGASSEEIVSFLANALAARV